MVQGVRLQIKRIITMSDYVTFCYACAFHAGEWGRTLGIDSYYEAE